MRVDVSIKLVSFDIKINIYDIIAQLKDNNLFYFRIWEKRTTMISFNFESSITMLISKQHNIKFVITIKFSILTSSSFCCISFSKTILSIKNVLILSMNLSSNLNISISFSIRNRFSTLTLMYRAKLMSKF